MGKKYGKIWTRKTPNTDIVPNYLLTPVTQKNVLTKALITV